MTTSTFFVDFVASFLPLFVAIDAIGMLPVYVAMTESLEPARRSKILRQAVIAGFITSLVILFGGKKIFNFLGITPDDFRVGGGLLLLLIAIADVTQSQKEVRRATSIDSGVVPLGIPLIIGPAALTTIMILVDRTGYPLTIISLVLNLLITWTIFSHSQLIVRIIGESGTKGVGKIISIFLMAIAVMMIRVGISNMIHAMGSAPK